VFPSTTKKFDKFAGLEFVRQVAAEISLPWYAIGGITLDNVDQVLEAGATRIAVSGAICGVEDHARASRAFSEKLAGG
jgi:thiamine-phosphate pyrophosphorylase